jgi:hypothetical protein
MRMTTWLPLLGAAAFVPDLLGGNLGGDWLVVLVVVVVLVVPLCRTRDRTASVDVPREFRGAPIAIGTVIGVTRTGRIAKGQPQLDIRLQVDTADGRSWVVTARQVVDTGDLAAVRPDALLPVRYLTDGRVTLATDAPAHVLQAALDRVHMAKGWLTPKQSRITEYGVDASAVVLEATPTGPTPDGRVGLRLRLLVTRPDGTTFELTQDKKLTPTSVQQMRPGMVVSAKYLPHDESDVAVITPITP